MDALSPRATLAVCVRAWVVSAVVLVVGGAGLFAVTASSTTTSLLRMAAAAAVLALLTTLAAVVCVPRDTWSPWARGACAAVIAVLVGVGTGLYVGVTDDLGSALFAAAPWLAGALLGGLLNPLVAELRWTGRLRLRRPGRGRP